jgi:hypothetical protein
MQRSRFLQSKSPTAVAKPWPTKYRHLLRDPPRLRETKSDGRSLATRTTSSPAKGNSNLTDAARLAGASTTEAGNGGVRRPSAHDR